MQDKEQCKVDKTGDQRSSKGSRKKRNVEILDAGESREDMRCLDNGTDQLKQQQSFEEEKKFKHAYSAESAGRANDCSFSKSVGNEIERR